jgi:hypothetical protein
MLKITYMLFGCVLNLHMLTTSIYLFLTLPSVAYNFHHYIYRARSRAMKKNETKEEDDDVIW